jgi:hypothetical protein
MQFDPDQAEEIRRKIQEGYDSALRGNLIDGEEFFRQLEEKEKRRIESQRPKHT